MKWQTQMNHTELTDLASITQSPPPMIVPVYLLSQFGGAIYHLSLTSGSTNTSSDGTAKKEDQAEVQQVNATPKPQLSRGNEGVYWISEASNIVLTSHSPTVIQRQQRRLTHGLLSQPPLSAAAWIRGSGGVWRLSSASKIVLFSILFQSLNAFSHFVMSSYRSQVTHPTPIPSLRIQKKKKEGCLDVL